MHTQQPFNYTILIRLTTIFIANRDDFSSFWFEILKWGTPVILFFVAYLINEIIKRKDRKKHLKSLKNYFITTLKELIKQNEAQIKQNIDCILRLKNYKENDLVIRKIAGNSIKRLNEIKFDDLFDLLVHNLKKSKLSKETDLTLFYELNRNIDYVETSIPTLFPENINFISELTQLQNQWNSILIKVSDFRNKIALSYNQNLPVSTNDKFANGFIFIYDNCMTLSKRDINNFHYAQQNLILPLIQHSHAFSNDPRAEILIQMCKEINVLYENMIHIRRQHRKFLIQITRGIIISNIDIKKSASVIESR